MSEKSHGAWYYQQLELGFNYRMTELQAALGISQLTRLDEFISNRHRHAKYYFKQLEKLPITPPKQLDSSKSSWHLFIIQLELDKITKSQQQIFLQLREMGIGVNLHYIPVHIQPYYQQLGFSEGMFVNAEKYYHHAISLPLFQQMTQLQIDTVINSLSKILE